MLHDEYKSQFWVIQTRITVFVSAIILATSCGRLSLCTKSSDLFDNTWMIWWTLVTCTKKQHIINSVISCDTAYNTTQDTSYLSEEQVLVCQSPQRLLTHNTLHGHLNKSAVTVRNKTQILRTVITICTSCHSIQILHFAIRICSCVSYDSHNKQRLFPWGALCYWSLQWTLRVFCDTQTEMLS
jgi:hypothetical protein